MAYDGSGDRQQEPVDNTLLCDPRPLLFDVSDHESKAYYGAEDLLRKLQSLKRDLKKIRSDFHILSLHTDNEETMRSLRRKWTEDDDESGAAGCGPHGVNLVIGDFWKWDGHGDTIADATALYNHCRNTKTRQALKQKQPGERRLGASSAGDTRWTTHRVMVCKLMDWQMHLIQISGDQQWRPYIPDSIYAIIWNSDF